MENRKKTAGERERSNVVVQVSESAFILRNYFWMLPKEIRKRLKKGKCQSVWLVAVFGAIFFKKKGKKEGRKDVSCAY